MITTFGKDAPSSWGDDDHIQTYFIVVPKAWTAPVYFRVFDPDVGGENDMAMGVVDTRFKYSILGGQGAYSDSAGRTVNRTDGYDSGTLIESKTFGIDPESDGKWVTIATLAAKEGEWDVDLGGYVFKVLAEGLDGDDGNLYWYYLSTSNMENAPVFGSNAFAYELCFRPIGNPRAAAHFYPFIKENVVKVQLNIYDMDDDGGVWLNSVTKRNFKQNRSGNDAWATTDQKIMPPEHNTSIDYRISGITQPENDMVIFFTNQYNEAIPFFSNPIGGVPRYGYKSDQQVIKRGDE